MPLRLAASTGLMCFDVANKSDAPLVDLSYRARRAALRQHVNEFPDRLRPLHELFKRNEEVIFASANLFVFIFVMTAIVYETQHYVNPNIHNYADALYFTITALTTTGFGDITLQGTAGRMISVVIMVCGVTLFLNLARTLFQPRKVYFQCPSCGLQRHDYDAVHCKACGVVLNLPNDERS